MGKALFIGAGNGNLFQYSCLENYTDGGGRQATVRVHGVTKSGTELAAEHTLTASLLVCMIGAICHKNFFKDSSVLIVTKVNQYLQKLNAKDLIINIKCLHLKKKQQSLKIAYYIQKVFL